ncbi:MAG: lytic transglycosylase domain-containing protein [Enterocloster clostridioformis]
MSLITSVAEAEALQRKRTETEATSNLSGTSFRNVLRDSLGGISEDMDAIFEEAAAKFSLPANLIKAVAKAESDFNPKAVSRAGAMGVMQLMPGTAQKAWGHGPVRCKAEYYGGAKYLKENLDCFGDVSLALAAYNAGPNSCQEIWRHPALQRDTNYAKRSHPI